MHHYKANEGTEFNFDFDGQIVIHTPWDQIATVPANDLLEFVAECYIRRQLIDLKRQLIRQVENTDWRDLLTGQWAADPEAPPP